MANEVSWRPKTGTIPLNPGVYRFRDATGRVLYVGKAKSLRARLTNYFGPLDSLHERTRRMVTTAASVEWTIVATELEALQLEYTWIKEFDPPFNVQFKDDKSYPYLAITMSEEVPRVMITRGEHSRGTVYLGPYVKVGPAREIIEQMLRVFPVRTCTSGVYARAVRTGKPCLLGDIGRCTAPCVGRISIPEHRKLVKSFLSFMLGHDQVAVTEVRRKMLKASQEQRYEDAAVLRDQLSALETVLSKSAVVLNERANADVIGLAEDPLTAAVQVFHVRSGRIRGVHGWVVDKEIETLPQEFVADLLQFLYGGEGDTEIPGEVLVPVLPETHATLQSWLTGMRGSNVSIHVPQRGQKASLIETATANAEESLRQYKNKRSLDFTTRSAALAEIQAQLGLPTAPLRIECYDISHLGGQEVVGSMVVFEDGLPKKNHYRKFHVEHTRDDTESIHQVLERRLKRLADEEEHPVDTAASFQYRPNLLLIDGGAPQVAAAQRAVDESGMSGISVCGMAKRLEEIWLPGEDFPVILKRNSEALFMLQRLRDEAHRFAITFQRSTRTKKMGTQLESIPGLGHAKALDLLRAFGSLARIRSASAEELSAVHGIGPSLSVAIRAWFDSTAE